MDISGPEVSRVLMYHPSTVLLFHRPLLGFLFSLVVVRYCSRPIGNLAFCHPSAYSICSCIHQEEMISGHSQYAFMTTRSGIWYCTHHMFIWYEGVLYSARLFRENICRLLAQKPLHSKRTPARLAKCLCASNATSNLLTLFRKSAQDRAITVSSSFGCIGEKHN